ncbi:MAG: hypothetical protein J6Q76_02325 [Clostridia bacterium]|nr:hypothetical protein [Clostridia bacterium]MBO5912289.1 hypothetical protein [Clostridia bacterium]
MNFTILGGDRRQSEIAQFLIAENHNVCTFGLPSINNVKNCDTLEESLINNDALILPLPASTDGKTVNAPLTGDIIFIDNILQYRPKLIFGGLITNNLSEEFSNRNIEYYDYYKSERLTVKNAVLTAEAAVAIAINCTDFSIFESKALVIGYGRIGKILSRYLKDLGADVTATSRNIGVLATINADNLKSENTNRASLIAGEFDYIFNTAPFPILNRTFFKNCKKTAFVEDLATNSGIDMASAKEYEINAGIYSGLPGKHSPKKAAKYIADEIIYYLKGGKNND